jgi:hypothetical protein
LFLNIACILAVFDISAPVGEKLEAKYKESTIRCVAVPDPLLNALRQQADAPFEGTPSRSSVLSNLALPRV